jgi:TM2 domain-containing membrane protein YozV
MDNLLKTIKQMFLSTSLDRWQVQHLDYNYYMIFSIFLGFFGLDYWYLGAPGTGILKFIVNITTFGYWWFYDIVNVVFNQEQVRLFGPAVPAVGSIGIGGARFRDDERPKADKETLDKHMNFMLYGLALTFLGIFGIDSLITGDIEGFMIRLGCFFTVILIPISLVWWIANLYSYYGNTNDCINQHWDFFGGPEPEEGAEQCPNPLMLFTTWILETLLAILEFIPGLGPIATFLRSFLDTLKSAYGMVRGAVTQVAKEAYAVRKGAKKLKTGLMQGLPTREELEALQQDPLPTEGDCSKNFKVKLEELEKDKAKEITAGIRGAKAEKHESDMDDLTDEEKTWLLEKRATKGLTSAADKAAGYVGEIATGESAAARGKLAAGVTGLGAAMKAFREGKSWGNIGESAAQALVKQGYSPEQIAKGITKGFDIGGKGLQKVLDTKAVQSFADKGGILGAIDRTTGAIQKSGEDYRKMMGQKAGGQESDNPILPLLLVATIGLIVVSGIVLSLRRSMQKNEPAKPDQRGGEKDDVPPEPGSSRVVATNA